MRLCVEAALDDEDNESSLSDHGKETESNDGTPRSMSLDVVNNRFRLGIDDAEIVGSRGHSSEQEDIEDGTSNDHSNHGRASGLAEEGEKRTKAVEDGNDRSENRETFGNAVGITSDIGKICTLFDTVQDISSNA